MLRRIDYGESDRILTLLTREHGRVGALARGVRRPESRLSAALELYGEIDAQLASGHSLEIVTQAVRLPAPRLPADLEHTAYAALVAEVAERVTDERHPEPGVFELTRLALQDLAVSPPARAAAWFVMAALTYLGYAPELGACAGCGEPLAESPHPFSVRQGGFLCPACAPPSAPLVPPATIKVLRVMASGDINLYRRLKLDQVLIQDVQSVLEDQLQYHLDRQLRSLRFLRQMRFTA